MRPRAPRARSRIHRSYRFNDAAGAIYRFRLERLLRLVFSSGKPVLMGERAAPSPRPAIYVGPR